MANEPIRRVPPRREAVGAARPKIWSKGDQRPPFDLRACRRACLYFSRSGVAKIHAWAARLTRRMAVNVANGAGSIPEARLGRLARFVPSHLRVAGWIKAVADILSHASASADPDIKRGNALVAEIAPYLWPDDTLAATPQPQRSDISVPTTVLAEPLPDPLTEPDPSGPLSPAMSVTGPATGAVADLLPTVAPEDMPPPPHDPLAAIRDDLNGKLTPEPAPFVAPPPAPGATGTMVVQVAGYVTGWLTIILALPYGLVRALWICAMGTDLRQIGLQD